MGNSTANENYAKKRKVISVISLNYSGILLSPFEFFSRQNAKLSAIETNLSNIYKALLKKEHPQFNENKKENKFKWSLGKIDQKMQLQRYSPLYNKLAGVEGNKMQSDDEFRHKWLQVFNQYIDSFKQKELLFKYTENQKKEALEFDLLCYKCIISHVYNKQFKDFSGKTMAQLNPQPYKQFMNVMFDKSFLNEQKKLEKTLSAMRKQQIDIVFVQQANQSLIKKLESIKDYLVYTRPACQSIIIIKKEKFHNFYNSKGKYPLSHLPELQKELLWNDDSIVAFVDNLILISGHLSSKKDKNPQQVYDMMQSLKKLHSIYPMCHIIVGCDANSFVPDTLAQYKKEHAKDIIESIKTITLQEKKPSQQPSSTDMQIYPSTKQSFTTSKQRTYLQPQVNKAEQVARVCRDHLIVLKAEDIRVEEARVCTISNRNPNEVENLPCEEHPYDHYVVKGLITVNVMTHFGKNYDDGK